MKNWWLKLFNLGKWREAARLVCRRGDSSATALPGGGRNNNDNQLYECWQDRNMRIRNPGNFHGWSELGKAGGLTVGQIYQECKETCESCRKAWFKTFVNKRDIFLVSVTHLILRFTNVQKKFQQTNKTKINHIDDNQINFEVFLLLGGIWPIVGLCVSTGCLSQANRGLKFAN